MSASRNAASATRIPATAIPGPIPLTVAQILSSGAPRWMLYGKGRDHPIQGVVVGPNGRSALENRVEAIRLKLSPGHFFSRRTAAAMYGMPIGAGDPLQRVEVGAIKPLRPLRRPEVRGHQVRAETLERMPVGPAWLPTVEDVWCMLAPVVSKTELLAVADWLVSGPSRHEEPASSLKALRVASRRFKGCAGAPLRQAVLPLVRTGVESPAESRLRLVIVENGLPEPATSCRVPTHERVFLADLGYPELKIAVEYEGIHHFQHGSLEQARRDVSRARAMQRAGWIVVRATALDLRDPSRFLSDLAAAIRERELGR